MVSHRRASIQRLSYEAEDSSSAVSCATSVEARTPSSSTGKDDNELLLVVWSDSGDTPFAIRRSLITAFSLLRRFVSDSIKALKYVIRAISASRLRAYSSFLRRCRLSLRQWSVLSYVDDRINVLLCLIDLRSSIANIEVFQFFGGLLSEAKGMYFWPDVSLRLL